MVETDFEASLGRGRVRGDGQIFAVALAEVIAAHWGLAFLRSSAVDMGARHPFSDHIQRNEVSGAPLSFE